MISGDQNRHDTIPSNGPRLRPVTQIHQWPQANDSHLQQQGQSPRSNLDDRNHLPFHEATSDSVEGPGHTEHSRADHLTSTDSQPVPPALSTDVKQIPCYEQSVWSKYQKRYQIDLNGMVAIAQTRVPSYATFIVRQTSKRALSDKLSLLQHLSDESAFVRVYEVFISSTLCQFVYESMDITLEHLLGAPVYPEEKQIAAIAGQIVQGLVFLHRDNFFHGNLKLSTVLANQGGEVKIAEGDGCQADHKKSQASCLRDVQNLGEIIMFLATKGSGEERRPDETRYSSDVLDFVSQANVSMANELSKHKLVNGEWSRRDLVWLFKFTCMTARRRHILPWQEPKGN